jgi:hypothetical protein
MPVEGECARHIPTVIPGLVPGIQRSASAGASGGMDPGNKCRDDSLRSYSRIAIHFVSPLADLAVPSMALAFTVPLYCVSPAVKEI